MKKHHRKPVPFDVKLIAAALLLLGVTAAAEFSGVFSTDDFVEANVIDVTGNTLVLGRISISDIDCAHTSWSGYLS